MRYFYKDALAAAWMAKHFGMKFQYAKYELSDLENPREFADFDQGYNNQGYYDLDINDPYPKYIIHLDSLHLLEPQVGDAVEFDRWYWERQRDESTKDYPYQSHFGKIVAYGNSDGWLGIASAGVGWDNTVGDGKFTLPFTIIQRNGKAFHWPDTEQP